MNRTCKIQKQGTANKDGMQKQKTNISLPSLYLPAKHPIANHINATNKILCGFNKQNNSNSSHLLPMAKQYSILKKINNKMDSFMEMETYFHNVYNERVNKRMQKSYQLKLKNKELLDQQRQRNAFHLPLIQATQQILQQNQLFRIKLQNIQKKMNVQNFQVLPILDQRYNYQQHPLQCPQHLHNNYGVQQEQEQQYPKKKKKVRSEKSSQNNQMNQNRKKQRRKMLMRKFRIYGYVVFFAMFLPQYSLLMAHYRLKDFIKKYLSDNNKTIQNCNQRLLSKFETIQVYDYARKVHLQSQTKQGKKSPKVRVTSEDQQISIVINLYNFKNIMVYLLQQFSKVIQILDDQLIDFLSICSLNNSFVSDSILTNQQFQFVNCDLQKCSLWLTQSQQNAMIISNIFIKKFIYQYIIRITSDLAFQNKIKEKNNVGSDQSKLFMEIVKEIELVSYFLYEICIKKISDAFSGDKHGNLMQLQVQSMPLTLSPMRFPSLFLHFQQRQLSYLSSIQQSQINKQKINSKKNQLHSKNQQSRQDKLQQFTQLIGQDPKDLIHNKLQFGQLLMIINYHIKSLQGQVNKKVDFCVQKIKFKMKERKKKALLKTKQRILSKKKKILTKQYQILEGIVFIRTNLQKQKIQLMHQYFSIIKDFSQNYQIRKTLRKVTSKISIQSL